MSRICVFAMRRGQEKAQPRGALRHGRIEDRLDVDAALEQRLREAPGADRAAGDDRHDRRADRTADIEAALARQPQKQRGAGVEPRHPLRLAAASSSSAASAAAAAAGAMPTENTKPGRR